MLGLGFRRSPALFSILLSFPTATRLQPDVMCRGEARPCGERWHFNSPPPLDTMRHLASQVDLSPKATRREGEAPRVSLALLTAPQVGGHVL